MSTIVELPIGDWLGIGHKQYDSYIVESNVPVDVLQDTHRQCQSLLGFDISCLCETHPTIDEYVIDTLEEYMVLTPSEIEELRIKSGLVDPDELFGIWVSLLMFLDPRVILTRSDQPPVECIIPQLQTIKPPGYCLYWN